MIIYPVVSLSWYSQSTNPQRVTIKMLWRRSFLQVGMGDRKLIQNSSELIRSPVVCQVVLSFAPEETAAINCFRQSLENNAMCLPLFLSPPTIRSVIDLQSELLHAKQDNFHCVDNELNFKFHPSESKLSHKEGWQTGCKRWNLITTNLASTKSP